MDVGWGKEMSYIRSRRSSTQVVCDFTDTRVIILAARVSRPDNKQTDAKPKSDLFVDTPYRLADVLT